MKQTFKKIFQELKEHVWNLRFYSMFIFVIIISIVLTLEPLFFWKIITELEKYYINWTFNTDTIIKITIVWFLFVAITQFINYIIYYKIITTWNLIDYKKSIKKYCNYTISMTMREYLWKKIWRFIN